MALASLSLFRKEVVSLPVVLVVKELVLVEEEDNDDDDDDDVSCSIATVSSTCPICFKITFRVSSKSCSLEAAGFPCCWCLKNNSVFGGTNDGEEMTNP